ncbi:MAG: hypothetical protein ACOCNU_04125 [Bacteroidales bacterium]
MSSICGYYDLSGRRLAGKQRGVNIVRYSEAPAALPFPAITMPTPSLLIVKSGGVGVCMCMYLVFIPDT